MNYKFVERAQLMTTADEYTLTYKRITDCTENKINNPFRQEYLDTKDNEMDRFNGKIATGDDENKS